MLPFYFIMKKIIFIITIIIFANNFNKLYAKDIIINIISENSAGQKTENAEFGLIDGATSGIDIELGEYEIPGNPQPNQIHMLYFEFIDEESDSRLLSYKDYRPIDNLNQVFYEQFKLRCDYGYGDTVTINWGSLPKEVVSAFFYDSLRATVPDYDMKKNTSIKVNNAFNNTFYIAMMFDMNVSSYHENHDIEPLFYYDRKSNMIVSNNGIYDAKYILVDYSGRIISSGSIKASNNIPLNNTTNKLIFLMIDYGIHTRTYKLLID